MWVSSAVGTLETDTWALELFFFIMICFFVVHALFISGTEKIFVDFGSTLVIGSNIQ